MPEPTVKLLNKNDLANLAVVLGTQNIIPWEYYDTITVANGNTAVTESFFANTRGANGLSITNIEQANILVSGKVMVVEEIQLDVYPTAGYVAGSLADMVTLTHIKSVFNFKINQVEYAQGLVKELIGGGLFGFGTPATNVAYLSPRLRPVGWRLPTPILVPTQTQFSLDLVYNSAPNPAASVDIRAKLMGKLARLTSA